MLLAVCVACGASAVSSADSGSAAVGTSLAKARDAGGARAAAATTIFVLAGTPAANTLSASADAAGRLVITSPDGIQEPDGPAPECVQDSPTQVSCDPGYVAAIAGDLGGGKDTFTAQPSLATLIGVSLVSEERPLSGGPGGDRISGGAGGDLINGGGGADTLLGLGGGDLMRGQAGRDSLSGGAASDVLLGGGGPDRMQGGAARDFCNGGGGTDTARSCNTTRKVP